MDYLWTPWRSTYMEAKKDRSECVFCRAARDPARDEETLVVYRGEDCFVILNRYPYTSGHLMVVPYEHISKLGQLNTASSREMMALVLRAGEVLERVYQPDGLNVGMNVGRAAGAGIDQHIHMHVLPRWAGDANFMTSIGDARILPEALPDTYRKVCEAFAAQDVRHSQT